MIEGREESGRPPEDDRAFVTALARGLDVLRCFHAGDRGLTNQEIARRTALPKPTVSRLTHTLRCLGYLVHSERTGTYRLGAGVLTLGYGALAGSDTGERAREEMADLCSGPNPHVTAALGERHGLRMVYVAVRRSDQAVALTMNVGARLPLFHSAMGRAVLAAMPADARAALLDRALRETPEEAERLHHSLGRALEDRARHGFCTSFGDWKKEINGIAVSVASPDGERLYGLNVGAPSFLVSPEELLERYGERLRRVAARLGARPGAAA